MTLNPNSQSMVAARSLSKIVQTSAGPLQVLDKISVEVSRGESLAVLGRSGSGKSTLLGLLAGLDQASSGQLLLDGKDLSAMNEDQRAALRKRHVSFVFQSFQLLPALSALENVMLPLELNNDNDIEARARHWLQQVGLGQRLDHLPSQLSGGEQQRVAIARAFVTEPDILFADEPTGNLDTATGAEIIELLFTLNQSQGTTLVLVTHDASLAQRCQRQITLEAGRLVDA